jgi:hypothetical protein
MMKGLESLTRRDAKKIITALRKGTPPEDYVEYFSIGREPLLEYFDEKLAEIRDFDLADVKFVNADWGHGKTHFLDLIRQRAYKYNFVTAMVQLHSRNAPFDKLEVVVQNMMRSISTPKCKDGGLEYLLEDWSGKQKGKTQHQILRELRPLPFPDMRMKLADYARHFNAQQYGQCIQVLKWFRGEETPSKTFKDVKEFLHSFTCFVRLIGYSGLVIMLDEAEAITSLSRIQKRDLANENIRQIIDNDRDSEGFYFVFASTSSFFDPNESRGASSYPALWRRISGLGGIRQESLEKVIVELPPLSEQEFFELASNIKSVFEIAEDMTLPQVRDDHLRLLANYVQKRADQRVGTLVRSTVALLQEACQEEFDFLRNYELIVERTLQVESRDRAR